MVQLEVRVMQLDERGSAKWEWAVHATAPAHGDHALTLGRGLVGDEVQGWKCAARCIDEAAGLLCWNDPR